MEHQMPFGNPFMLMMHPEVVLAAVKNSDRLSKLERRLCRPLDRPAPGAAADDASSAEDEDNVSPDSSV